MVTLSELESKTNTDAKGSKRSYQDKVSGPDSICQCLLQASLNHRSTMFDGLSSGAEIKPPAAGSYHWHDAIQLRTVRTA
eukprot:s4189_g3.t1